MDDAEHARKRIAEIEAKMQEETDHEMVMYYALVLTQWRAYLARVEGKASED